MIELNDNLTFDEAYAQLEEAVHALETPGMKFEESLALYEKACALSVFCQCKLNDAKLRITEIDEYVKQYQNVSDQTPDGSDESAEDGSTT